MDLNSHNPEALRLLRGIKRILLLSSAVNFALLGVYVVLATWAMYRLFFTATLRRRTFWMLAAFTVASSVCYAGFTVGMAGAAYRVLFLQGKRTFDDTTIIVACLTVTGALSDALLTFRCWIIWERSRWVGVPIVIMLAELICFVVQDVRLGFDGLLWEVQGGSEKAAIAGLALNLVLNVTLALAAIARLLRARKELRRAALPGGGQHYVEISRVLALIAFAYVAVWAPTLINRKLVTAIMTSVILMSVITLSPLLIALQVGERARTPVMSSASAPELPEIVVPG